MSNQKKRHDFERAIGLSYSENTDSAPTIVIKEISCGADDAVRIARRFGIPVVEKPELARGLEHFEEGEEIPQELYEAVAIILNGIEKAKRRYLFSKC